jgi:hypothetical protein
MFFRAFVEADCAAKPRSGFVCELLQSEMILLCKSSGAASPRERGLAARGIGGARRNGTFLCGHGATRRDGTPAKPGFRQCRKRAQITQKKNSIGLQLAVLAVLAIAGLVACTNKQPLITGISPKVGSAGDIITISGEHFGRAREQSYITIAGERPTASSYTLWQDDTIKARITRTGVSGLIYVFSGGKQSNGVMFSDRDTIPQKPEEGLAKAVPIIEAVTPRIVSPGEILTITGAGFGASREETAVFFTWDVAGRTQWRGLPASVFEGGYESWGRREIRVRVPDGAGTGTLVVGFMENSNGGIVDPPSSVVGAQSNLEISRARGRKMLREGREYIVALSTDVIVQEATLPNALYLAVPRPVAGASQQITRVLSRMPNPFEEHHRGATLYKIPDMRPEEAMRVSVSYLVAVCAVETSVVQTALAQDLRLPVYKTYLGKSLLVPAGNAEIVAKAAAISGRERNPYLKAQLIYRALLRELTIETDAGTNGALEALQTGIADSYSASLLFSALCRAAGIPAAPYAGVLVSSDRSTAEHYWAAFWLDGIGWVPVDIAFGAGVAPDNWTLRPDYAAWYFGNMDNQRVAFSFGENTLSPVDPKGRTVGRPRSYALQNIWEEAIGGLESYSSLWSDISINGVYLH